MIEGFITGFIITVGAILWYTFVFLIELYVEVASWFA